MKLAFLDSFRRSLARTQKHAKRFGGEQKIQRGGGAGGECVMQGWNKNFIPTKFYSVPTDIYFINPKLLVSKMKNSKIVFELNFGFYATEFAGVVRKEFSVLRGVPAFYGTPSFVI